MVFSGEYLQDVGLKGSVSFSMSKMIFNSRQCFFLDGVSHKTTNGHLFSANFILKESNLKSNKNQGNSNILR